MRFPFSTAAVPRRLALLVVMADRDVVTRDRASDRMEVGRFGT